MNCTSPKRSTYISSQLLANDVALGVGSRALAYRVAAHVGSQTECSRATAQGARKPIPGGIFGKLLPKAPQ